MAVFTSAKSAQYAQILLLGRKQRRGFHKVHPIFEGQAYSIEAVYQSTCHCHEDRHISAKVQGVFVRLLTCLALQPLCQPCSVITDIGHTFGKDCQYAKKISTEYT